MDRQNRNTKKATKALIAIGAILILALAGAIVYFYTIKDQVDEDEFDDVTCGCYLIDPAVVNDCGDPKRAFLFNLNTVSSDKTCNASCDINDVADNLLNSTTAKESFKSCTVRSISDTRCENMILKDQDGRIITGRIQPTDEINVEATFDKSTYTDYSFKVNTETIIPDNVEGNKITKKVTDFEGVNSVEIIATAKDAQGEQINSIVCRRVVDLQTGVGTTVTGMTALTEQQSDGKSKVSNLTVSVGQLSSENVKIRFSFSPTFTTLTANDGILIESAKGTISMSKLDLYDTNNFTADSFNVLNSHLGELTITAEVFVDDANIGSASTKVEFKNTSVTPTDPTDEEPTDEEPIAEGDKSNFSVTKSVAQACVERTVGNNLAAYTITVRNNRSVADSISYVKDKLPLGFVYSAESTTVNGSSVADSTIVTVTPIGDTQEIVWQPSTPWSVAANGLLTITFESTASANAIPGQNLNEVIVNPVEIPLDPETLRTEVAITVALDCENITEEEATETPSTGIFDSFAVRILFGVAILLTGWLIYVRPEGNILSEKILNSKLYGEMQYNSYKVTNPRKYFEEKTLRKKSKGR